MQDVEGQPEECDFVLRMARTAVESLKESQVLAGASCSVKDAVKQREDRSGEELFYGSGFS